MGQCISKYKRVNLDEIMNEFDDFILYKVKYEIDNYGDVIIVKLIDEVLQEINKYYKHVPNDIEVRLFERMNDIVKFYKKMSDVRMCDNGVHENSYEKEWTN